MSRRITFLTLGLLLLFSLAAAAASEPVKPAAPAGPGASGAVANAPAPAVDLSWLLQPGAPSTSQEPAANDLFGAKPAFTCTTCVCLCVQGGGDTLCCRYQCHPIGMDPC
jgi:hypothetical protein